MLKVDKCLCISRFLSTFALLKVSINILNVYRIMGQYFKGIILSKNRKEVVASVDPDDFNNGLKFSEHAYIGSRTMLQFEGLINDKDGEFCGYPVAWSGDYSEPLEGYKDSLYKMSSDEGVKRENLYHQYRYLINCDKKVFVDMSYLNEHDTHPLPFLCSDSGNFDEEDEDNLFGKWCLDKIKTSDKRPNISYQEIIVDNLLRE